MAKGAAGLRLRRSSGVVTAVCGLVLGLSGGQAAAAGQWKLEQPFSATESRILFDVSATGAQDGWAVGSKPNADGKRLDAAIEHWDGTAWTDVAPADSGGRSAQLQEVTASAPDDAWAAGVVPDVKPGQAGPRLRTRPGSAVAESGVPIVLQHWDGKKWTNVERPAPPAGWLQFPGKIKAFGKDWAYLTVMDWQPSTNSYQYRVEHWDGKAWNPVKLPDVPAGLRADAWAIDGTGPDDVWITVNATGKDKSTPLVNHWDGKKWEQTALPVPSEHPTGWLVNHVVVVDQKSVYAFGKSNDPEVPAATMALHWDGAAWKPLPAIPFDEANAAGVDGAGTVWVGGWPGGQLRSALARWDGTAWTTEQLPPEVAEQGGEDGQNSILGLSKVPGTRGVLASGLVADNAMNKGWGLIVSRGLR
ncbi:hypothetical protein [Amycolatopsis anabasis]|uniref:hypothetical protein n=1 Tax=Amycolatopsis anabasis TaxID=1840409 RepID=UPI00131E35EC|nr:hypothetical protein [Amycolatopsis anabasis]